MPYKHKQNMVDEWHTLDKFMKLVNINEIW
jgi:hypothetical protein